MSTNFPQTVKIDSSLSGENITSGSFELQVWVLSSSAIKPGTEMGRKSHSLRWRSAALNETYLFLTNWVSKACKKSGRAQMPMTLWTMSSHLYIEDVWWMMCESCWKCSSMGFWGYGAECSLLPIMACHTWRETAGFHYVFVQHQGQQIPTGYRLSLCALE